MIITSGSNHLRVTFSGGGHNIMATCLISSWSQFCWPVELWTRKVLLWSCWLWKWPLLRWLSLPHFTPTPCPTISCLLARTWFVMFRCTARLPSVFLTFTTPVLPPGSFHSVFRGKRVGGSRGNAFSPSNHPWPNVILHSSATAPQLLSPGLYLCTLFSLDNEEDSQSLFEVFRVEKTTQPWL